MSLIIFFDNVFIIKNGKKKAEKRRFFFVFCPDENTKIRKKILKKIPIFEQKIKEENSQTGTKPRNRRNPPNKEAAR